eukprot:snap_masked-scaffold_8-processed-gene-12.38-mRNA-1 protein AED:1.00 eAED:1.00 QI:0/-1/0/0/-1/1/1/0/1028
MIFVYFLFLKAVSSQRIGDDQLIEYNFLLKSCIVGRSFFNTGTLDSIGEMINLITPDHDDTFTCPGFENDDLVFENAFNGFRTSGEEGAFGVTSKNHLNTTLLEDEFTMEMWIFPEGGLGENKIVEISQEEIKASWNSGTNEEFDFQIMLLDETRIFVRLGVGPDSVDLYIFELEESIQPFSLYHLVFTYSFSEIAFSINGVQENHVLNNHLAFGENRFLTLGGGYEEVGRSFPGSIVYFSLYDFVLSSEQIQQNYEAGVPQRNGPVISDKTFFKKEDEELVIDLREAVFDLDDLRVEENEDELHFKILSSASRGQLFLDGELISSLEFPKTFEPDQVLSYKQTEENNFDAVDNLDIRISDTNSFSTASNKNAEITIRILEGNDKPKVESVNKGVALSRKIEFELVGSDVDSPFRDEESFIPTNFQITKISETSFGNFVDCETNELLELPQNFTANIKEEDSSEFFSIVCYKAKDEGESDESGVIGEDIFEVILIDGEGEKSEPRDISIQITLDIFVGCGDIGGTPCEELIQEGEELNFTLKAIDSLCDAGEQETNPVCEGAQKEIIIVQPLLNISQGYLSYYLDEEEIIISEDDFTNENNLFGYRLPKDIFELKYTPSEFYFNVAPAPLCGQDIDYKCAGAIDSTLSEFAEAGCQGPLCPELTSYSLRNEIIGYCGIEERFDDACPLQVFYRMSTRGILSPEIHSLGQLIWVRHDMDDFVGDLPKLQNVKQTLDIVDRVEEESRIRINSIDRPLYLKENHTDLRIVSVSIKIDAVPAVNLLTYLNLEELETDPVNLQITNDHIVEFNLCVFNGCPTEVTIQIAAPVSTVNELLDKLQIQILNPEKIDFPNATLVFRISHLDRGNAIQTFTLPIVLRNIPSTGKPSLFVYIAIYISTIFLVCGLFRYSSKMSKKLKRGRYVKKYKDGVKYNVNEIKQSQENEVNSVVSTARKRKSRKVKKKRKSDVTPPVHSEKQVGTTELRVRSEYQYVKRRRQRILDNRTPVNRKEPKGEDSSVEGSIWSGKDISL